MVLLRCVDRHEADLLMTEVHEGSFGTHTNGHAMCSTSNLHLPFCTFIFMFRSLALHCPLHSIALSIA